MIGRRIILGVGGGVAAFKAAYLARRFIEAGATVRVVMTAGATNFIGVQTFRAITGQPVITSLFGAELASPHTELARWADAIVVAPATANIIARVANGLSGDALSATILAADLPVLMAPAMHTEMWEQPATVRNVETLVADGRIMVGPVSGALAGGDTGTGRMAEPEQIVAVLDGVLPSKLTGLSVVVTAGGTREAIDPVRFLGNRSSGKMGYAVAAEAARRGASVTLVSSARRDPPDGVEVLEVESAEDMANATWALAESADVAVLAAAVADFRPKAVAPSKLARTDGAPEIVLEETPNVLAGVVERRKPGSVVVGFAAETGSLRRAHDKATTYGVDLLVANDVTEPGSGFETDTNRVTFITPSGETDELAQLTKDEVAVRLWDRIETIRE